MTRKQMINKILSDEADVISQWVMQGCYEDLTEYLSTQLEVGDWTDEEVQEEYEKRCC